MISYLLRYGVSVVETFMQEQQGEGPAQGPCQWNGSFEILEDWSKSMFTGSRFEKEMKIITVDLNFVKFPFAS